MGPEYLRHKLIGVLFIGGGAQGVHKIGLAEHRLHLLIKLVEIKAPYTPHEKSPHNGHK